MSDDNPVLPAEEPEVESEPPFDAGDPATIKRRTRKLEFQQQQAADFWKRVFASEVGRREMWNILQACHTFETKFACGPTGFPQPEATWFHAGEASIGERLFHSWSRIDRDGVWRMLDEHDARYAAIGKGGK